MIPLVGSVEELEIIEADAKRVLVEVAAQTGVPLNPPIGTMIDLPRAALAAGQIARLPSSSLRHERPHPYHLGVLPRRRRGSVFPTYLEMGTFGISPFETLDVDGVGELVEIGTERGRATRLGLKVDVCGERGGDPESVHFFHRVGLDYVSCSPFASPVARIEAGRMTLEGTGPERRFMRTAI
jgi:pyruvate,orthophosphate dikinase